MTLQLLVVLMTGFMLAPGAAVATLMLYLACGSAGLPVFAGVGGVAGPTGGYLVGFLVAAWLISVLKGSRNAGWICLFGVGFAGASVVLILGVLWRLVASKFLGLSQGGVSLVVLTSIAPFLVKATVEVAVAVALVQALRGVRLRRAGSFD
jgi:biotin transport system substrate-specific component